MSGTLLIDKEAPNDRPFDSHGYGYCFLFLRVFPARLIIGRMPYSISLLELKTNIHMIIL